MITIDFSGTYEHFPNRESVRFYRKTAEGEWGEDFTVENAMGHATTKEFMEGGRRVIRQYRVFHLWRTQFDADAAIQPKAGDKIEDSDGVAWVIAEPVQIMMEGNRYRCTCERAK